jgi:hypothetical protein
MHSYSEFLESKLHSGADQGFDVKWMPDMLFDFQQHIVTKSLRRGRSAVFADCGLGKTPMGLTWATNVARHTGKPVLYLTPLAVGPQTVTESEKFGIEARQSRDGSSNGHIIVTNYEKLHMFDPAHFGGVVCDESSILKSFNGVRKSEITAFMRKVPYRLLQTATAAPNDFIELGTSSEALGYLGYVDMLNKFFKNDLNNSAQGRMGGEQIKWRLKGHAELHFWRWVCSWAMAIRKPSDIGFDDSRFILPPIEEVEHMVNCEKLADGMLFALPAIGPIEQREERRRSIQERCEMAASLVRNTGKPAVIWCDLNDEGDMLEKMLPDAIQVSGKDSDDAKEAKLTAFSRGDERVLITKHKIAGWGMNWQHCAHTVTFPSNSYEGYYQKIRRFYRFGQTQPVRVDLVTTEGGKSELKNMKRKAAQAETMFANLIAEMNNAISINRPNNMKTTQELPSWLSSTK